MTDTPPPRPTTVKAVHNGPLQVKGTLTLLGPDGEAYDVSGRHFVLLCRCGHSKNKPFCDGSHTRVGFTSDDRAPTPEEAHQGRSE